MRMAPLKMLALDTMALMAMLTLDANGAHGNANAGYE